MSIPHGAHATATRPFAHFRLRAANPGFLTGIALGIGGVATALIFMTDWFPAGYRSPSLSLAVNTVDGCIALLVAYLAHGRFVRDRRVRYRLIAHGLALLGAASVVLPGAFDILGLHGVNNVSLWSSAAVRVTGAVLILSGALAGDRTVRRLPPRGIGFAFPAVMLAVILVLARLVGPGLPPALVPTGPVGHQLPLTFTSQPAFAGMQSLSALCFLVAAVAFARLALRNTDQLLDSLGPAFALGTFALFQYALFPTLSTDWLYSGDVLRTGCYLLLLLGGAAEIRRYWSVQTHAAVLEDRRRLAREIHDGVVQEIAYIRMESQSLQPGTAPIERIIDACDRALDEARDAVHALALSTDEPLDHLLQRAAHDLSRRYRVEIPIEIQGDHDADPDQRYAIVRIVREAIANAVRHGNAQLVTVRLESDAEGRLLEVRDDGCGFDPAEVGDTAGGYGLISMRERADALPGRCHIESQPGAGTTVRVVW
jgi:signal transduction histidine kinase